VKSIDIRSVSLWFVFVLGCSASEFNTDTANLADWVDAGISGANDQTGTGSSGRTSASVLPVGVCDEQNFYPSPKRVAVMLLQDLSLSMTVDLAGRSKWDHAKGAINTLLSDPVYKNMGIRFGFDYFPDTSSKTNQTTKERGLGCGVDDPVAVDADVNTESKIIDWINRHEPDGATPLYCAINKFNDPTYAPLFAKAQMEKYLVIISDGADACGIGGLSANNPQQFAKPADLEGVTRKLVAATESGSTLDVKQWPIRVIAIGFGNSVAPSELNAIAKAGGVFDTYIDAKNSEELQQAFKKIGNAVVSCTWEVEEPGVTADRHKVNFYLNGQLVPYLGDGNSCGTASGWVWSNSDSVEFCNEACVQIRKGTQFAARFGCPSLR
jgi:hypothetical protein